MVDAIARSGSTAAARELGKVPSALTYSVRQLERAGRACSTAVRAKPAHGGGRGLPSMADACWTKSTALANRVQRVATGWRPA
jgi:hypothetical protein